VLPKRKEYKKEFKDQELGLESILKKKKKKKKKILNI